MPVPVVPRDSGLPGPGGSAGWPPSRATLVAALALLLALGALLLPSVRAPRRRAGSGPRLELGPGPGLEGFARATQVRPFLLPADHGPHFDYRTEWWYYTGNVAADDGRRFGFQLTFFRRGLSPGPPPEGPGLSSNQVYFAHFAITDVAAGRHSAAERFSRGAGGLAGASGEPFAVWLEDWRASSCCGGSCAATPAPPVRLERVARAPLASPSDCDGGAVRLVARDTASGLSLDLDLAATKPLVAHGDRGLSPKSDEPGNASYYVGYTRMAARGRMAAADTAAAPNGEHAVDVGGEAWFDHEWSTSALGPGAVGWDWFSLQLDDGRELLYFQIRREDGEVEPVSGGTLVEPDGRTRRLSRDDVRVDVLRRWTSPDTGTTYPCRWRLAVRSEALDLEIEPWLEAQEMRTSFVYWEGAVRVSDAAAPGSDDGRRPGPPRVTGHGYVELTGYAVSMQGVF
jgi:predicted secreted hydrolase